MPVNKNRLSPMQTVTELPRMEVHPQEVQLPEFDYSNTLVRRNSFKERPAEPPHPCFRKPGDGPGDVALDLEGARAKISGNKYLEHVLPDKI